MIPVAVILVGHARTYDLTAKSVREKLIGANPTMDFTVFALAYSKRDRKRGADRSKHTRMAGTVSAARIREKYPKVIARVLDESEIKQRLPWRLTPNASYLNQHRFRIAMMFRMIAEAHSMIPQGFDIILKMRFDLKIFVPFIIRPELVEDLSIVVPEHMQRGPSGLSPGQIRTRPCNFQGSKTPEWVQDHIAYGAPRAMRYFCNGTDTFMRSGAGGLASPEVVLATYMNMRHVNVKCDPSIKYTIIR